MRLSMPVVEEILFIDHDDGVGAIINASARSII